MVSKISPEKKDSVTGITVASVLIDYLALEGVDRIFGYPGAALGVVLNELRGLGAMDYIICRHETAAAYIADTYSRITGKLGVVLVTTGPGATNALTGVMNAQSMNSSLLLISGEVPQKYWGRAALQAGADAPLKIVDIYRHACGYSALISSPKNFQELLKQSLRVAMSIPHRAAHISLPQDLAGQPMGDALIPTSSSSYRAIPAGTSQLRAAEVLDILTRSALPLIWLGNGCRQVLFPGTHATPQEAARIDARREQFFAFLDRFALPVMTTGDAKGLFPESSLLSLRNYGLGGSPWPTGYVNPVKSNPGLNAKFDALCVLGSSLSQLATNSWAPEMIPVGPFIQVDADQSIIGRGYPVDLGIVAELGAFIDQLIELANKNFPNQGLCEQRMRHLETVRAIAYPPPNPQAEYLIQISKYLPDNCHVLVDACTADALALQYFVVDPPMQMHNSLVQGPIGSAIAGVVGAAFATDRPCVAICGDGGFLMHGAEINTAAQHNLGCLWIVFQNQELGTVVDKMQKDFPEKRGKSWEQMLSLGNADLVGFARGLGADAVEVTSLDAIGPAVEKALIDGRAHQRPQVIVIPTQLYPMPPDSGDYTE